MKSQYDHPWLSNPFPFADVDSIRVCMKNTAALLESDLPPEWIIVLDKTGRFTHSRTRVVVAEQAVIDFEYNVGDAPSTMSLSEDQLAVLSGILKHVTPHSCLDADNNVIDGSPCVVTVANGKQKWIVYGEFNIAGMSSVELRKPGPELAMFLGTMSREITD